VILSDGDILREIEAGRIIFEPAINEEDVSPSSVDVHLGTEVSIFKSVHAAIDRAIDLAHPDIATSFQELLQTINISADGYRLEPGRFILSKIKEKLTLPFDIAARLEGRSTNARFGLTIHSTAPTVHPTYSGHLALEICNLGQIPIILRAGFPIGQLIFERLESPPLRVLDSVWQEG
jgi:dCTP deaminase